MWFIQFKGAVSADVLESQQLLDNYMARHRQDI
jgi:hypothetical protein